MRAITFMRNLFLAVLAASLLMSGTPAIATEAVQQDTTSDARVVRMLAEVEDTYQSFSSNSFYVPRYNVTYKTISFLNGYTYTGSTAISYTSGTYHGVTGHITLFKCNYTLY